MELKNVKAIVTGGAQGMGACFARRLAEAGARVAVGDVGDVNDAMLAELPPGIARRRLDVRDENECVGFVKWAASELGGVNVLVNNAGIIRDGLLVKKDRETGSVKKLSREDWDAVLGVNLTGATMMVREVAAHVAEAGTKPAVIVNLSSISRHGNRGQSNYVAAKAALAANTVTWARDLAPLGVRVCSVAPGMIETPMTRGMNQKARDAVVAQIPVGRIGGHLARRAVRDRVRLLQRQDGGRGRRPRLLIPLSLDLQSSMSTVAPSGTMAAISSISASSTATHPCVQSKTRSLPIHFECPPPWIPMAYPIPVSSPISPLSFAS
jgi:3-oxoacyl-[acyl-carrier protein] reductase